MGAAVYNAGAVQVRVDEKKLDGAHIHLALPASVVNVGLKFAPDYQLRHASKEVQPWVPAIKIATEELAKYPYLSLVEVDDTTDHVRIFKHGDKLVIDVDTPEETVHVSVPLSTILSAVKKIEAAGPGV